jgi:hypothetical protein
VPTLAVPAESSGKTGHYIVGGLHRGSCHELRGRFARPARLAGV